MNFFKVLLLSLSLLPASFAFAATENKAELDAADKAYQDGECETAINAYQNILKSSSSSTEDKDKANFRIGYCHYSLGNYNDAESTFAKYLSTHPKDEEAMLKFAQTELSLNKFQNAEVIAKKISSNDYKFDATVVLARVKIETEKFSEAIAILEKESGNPEALYWKAIALYRNDKDDEAEAQFKLAFEKAKDDNWVKSDSKSWLDSLQNSKRKMHFRVTIGALHDTNIDQSGGSGTVHMGGSQGGGPVNPESMKANYSTANYTQASGGYTALDFIHNTYESRKLSVTTTLSGSTPFYVNHASYNQQQLSLDLSTKYTVSNTLNYGASAKYLDTFYNKAYSQDYVYFTPFVSWSFSNEYWLKFSVPYTLYLNSKKIKNYGGSIDLSYDPINWLSIYAGTSYTKSTGPEVVIIDTGSSMSLQSGTMFSHYKSYGLYIGGSYYFGGTYSLGVTGSYYKTSYDLEKFPPTNTAHHTPREDKLKSISVNFSKTFWNNALTAALSYTHTTNDSEGFPGLLSNGVASNNTYKRGYTLATLAYYY